MVIDLSWTKCCYMSCFLMENEMMEWFFNVGVSFLDLAS